MAITQEVILLNEFGFAERRRTTSAGTKLRYTVSIQADVIPHVFDAQALGRGPAEAIAGAIKKQIKAISQTASLGTQLFRKSAAKAFAAGKSWAQARYSGGRTGPTPPLGGDGLFNDSGRLADGIFVQAVGDTEWTVNVPANRFDPSTFKTESQFVSMVTRLQALVPALRGEGLAQDQDVAKAIRDSMRNLIVTTMNVSSQKATSMISQWSNIVRQGLTFTGFLP